MPRTDLPPPGNGFRNGETYIPPCSANATEVNGDGYGWEANRTCIGNDWWSGHRNGYNNLGTNTQDIQEFKGAMDWTNTQLTGHLTDDVRFWATIQAI